MIFPQVFLLFRLPAFMFAFRKRMAMLRRIDRFTDPLLGLSYLFFSYEEWLCLYLL